MLSDDHYFTNIGIDSIGFHAPRYYLKLDDLAEKRKIDPEKYSNGLRLKEMRLPGYDEDIISMGLKAAYNALYRGNIDAKEIDAVFVGTETMTYAVKSVSNIFTALLGIPTNCWTQDIYNACAAGTLAIVNAIGLIEKDLIKKALVICADISSYDINSPSEPTQGSGAIAFVISKKPRIATFSKKFGKVSGNVNDFFRPANEENAQVFGHYSVDTYLNFQLRAYDDLIENMGNFYADYYTFHAPFSKLPVKCMQQIIQKRWLYDAQHLLDIEKDQLKSSLLKKIDSFLHGLSVLPEYIYLKLKERGFTSEKLEGITRWWDDNIKRKVLPQLRVPMFFGNMYNASVWAQITYVLENYAHEKDTIYFGSYGSGATCISGLLKVKKDFASVMEKGPKINDFIDNKTRVSVKEYELLKQGNLKPMILIGNVVEHEENDGRGFILHYCDKGCIIPNIEGLNYCPKGHPGFHEKFFPLYGVLKSNPTMTYAKDLSFLKKDLVRVAPIAKKGNNLEYEIRRINLNDYEICEATGLLNWAPMYLPAYSIY